MLDEASHLVSNLKNQGLDWKSCDNLYFKAPKREIKKPFIGLISKQRMSYKQYLLSYKHRNEKQG